MSGSAPSYSLFAVATTSERGESDRSVAPGPRVLETKLARPPSRAEHVSRRELVELLGQGLTRPLTLVAAPPGFGKTTLLAAWAAEAEARVAWVSLDEGDNDPSRFFAYLVAALRTVEPGVGEASLSALAVPGISLVDVVLPPLINELAAVADELIVVLDDYHVITNRDVQDAVAYLLERLPASLRLVLATREDPPLPLARLRARGQLVELRGDQLRFTADETRAFLNDSLGLGISAEDIERLKVRTEGWPAALYLAALSLRDQPNPSNFIQAFAGDDRHVVDYLTGEVLARQSAERRSFLLRTSILSRLSGSLCDAVTEGAGSADTLVELERSNLLLVPLDAKREWYRYHHLFADLLQHELKRIDGEAVTGLHRRASGWYRDAGFVVDAAHHAYAAGDLDAAIDLVGRNWSLFLDRGQLATVRGWLDALPTEMIGANRSLCLAAAMVASNVGRFDDVEHWLDRADSAPQAVDFESASTFEALRAWLPMAGGDVDGTIAAARRALSAAPWDPVSAIPPQLVLASALWWSQELAEARSLVESASQAADAAGLIALKLLALGLHAAIEFDADDSARAEALADGALALLGRAESEQHPFAAMAQIVVGKTRALNSTSDEAITHVERGIQLAELNHAWHFKVYGLLALAQIRQRAHDAAQARRLLRRARDVVDTLPKSPGEAHALERIERTERMLRLRATASHEAAGSGFSELSEREGAVLRLLATKLSQREIASELYVSFNTVKTHTRAIFRKLGVATRAEAVERARELGLI